MAVGEQLNDPGVDGGVADVLQITALSGAGVQQQSEAVDPHLAGQPVEERHGRRVGERVGQALVDNDPDRADAATTQPPRHRVRPGEAELRGPGR